MYKSIMNLVNKNALVFADSVLFGFVVILLTILDQNWWRMEVRNTVGGLVWSLRLHIFWSGFEEESQLGARIARPFASFGRNDKE